MKRGNVLVIGNTGSGKSTLIKSVLGNEMTVETFGKTKTAEELAIYEGSDIPFRFIETVGFDCYTSKPTQTINSVKRWIKDDSKKNNSDTQIDVIWFCLDGMNKRFIDEPEALAKAVSNWDDLPVIIVITQSYNTYERGSNIDAVNNTLAKMHKHTINAKKTLAVVADNYIFNETGIVPQEGISQLIDITNSCMPEENKLDDGSVAKIKLAGMRMAAHTTVAGAAALAVGAGKIKGDWYKFITPVMINNIIKIYELGDNSDAKALAEQIVEITSVGKIAQTITRLTTKSPGKAELIIPAVVTLVIGEYSIYMFEQIKDGKQLPFSMDTIIETIEKYLSQDILEAIAEAVKGLKGKINPGKIVQIITETLKKFKK